MFPQPTTPNFGEDLVARNIQRGRDHGLPGYCCYYNLHVDKNFNCNNGWDKRYNGISQTNWNLLKTIYKNPSDIDVFTGGLAQDPHNGGLTGQVFQKMKRKILILSTNGYQYSKISVSFMLTLFYTVKIKV